MKTGARGGGFETLVTKNPMTVEIRRATRRYLTFSNASGTVTFGFLLGVTLYAILFLVVVNTRGDIHPKVVLGIHLLVAALLAPMTLHASIAGERERRSWDMLMVAPVTHAQVVVGKLLGGIAVQLGLAAAMVLPTLVAAISYARDDGMSLYGLLRMELVVLATGVFCCALTMLISARVKRAFVALGVSITSLLLTFVFLPSVLGLAGGGPLSELLLAWHPVAALLTIDERRRYRPDDAFALAEPLAGLVAIASLLAFAAIFVLWTVKTVAYADNEVRFLPGKKGSQD